MAIQTAQRAAQRSVRGAIGFEQHATHHGVCLRHAPRRIRMLRPGRCQGVIRADIGTRLLRKGTFKLRQPGQDEEVKQGSQFFGRTGTQGSLFSGGKKPQNTSLVFVAGATGRLGARIVRELLQAGFSVRAGVRNLEAAQQYAEVAVKYELLTPEQEKRLTLVGFDLEKPETLKAAIGSAMKVVCAVGCPESDVLDSTGPRRVDGEGTISLIEAAGEVGVEQFVLVTSLGTAKFGWPASALNLFWGILTWKRKAEEALEKSGMTYTIVRPGGMERPKDNYKDTHNLVLAPRDTYFGGQVSRLQVAELVGAIISNVPLAENKVLEVIAETTAPEQRFEDLLVAIPSDITKEEQQQLREAQAVAQQALGRAQGALDAAIAKFKAAEEKVKETEAKLKQLKAEEAGTRKEVTPTIAAGAKAEAALAAAREKVEKTAKTEVALKAILEATKKAGQQGELLSDKDRQQIFQNIMNPPPPPPKAEPVARKSIFGRQPSAKAAAEAKDQKKTVSDKQEPGVEVVATPSLFGGLFGAKPAPPKEEEAPAPEPAPKVEEKPAAPVGLFGGLFAPKKAAAPVAEPEPEPEAPKEEPKAAPKLNAAQLARQAAREKAEAAAKAKSEAEAKKKADTEAKAKAAAEAKAKAEAETKAKAVAEADAKKKSEAESKAKAVAVAQKADEAEAKKKAEAAAKAKADTEAKAKADTEAKVKAGAEAKAKAEEDAKAKAAAEAKTKADAAATATAEAEAKAKAEAEAKKKAEVEAKAKAEAETKAKAEAKVKAEQETQRRKEEELRLKKEAETRAKAAAAEQARIEAAALAAIEADKKAAAAAKAKAKAEAEAKTIAEAKAKQAAAAAAAAPKVVVAPKAVATSNTGYDADAAASAKKEAQQWISKWAAKQTAVPSNGVVKEPATVTKSKPTPKGTPSAQASAAKPTKEAPDAASKNVKEARKWIANWKSQQGTLPETTMEDNKRDM